MYWRLVLTYRLLTGSRVVCTISCIIQGMRVSVCPPVGVFTHTFPIGVSTWLIYYSKCILTRETYMGRSKTSGMSPAETISSTFINVYLVSGPLERDRCTWPESGVRPWTVGSHNNGCTHVAFNGLWLQSKVTDFRFDDTWTPLSYGREVPCVRPTHCCDSRAIHGALGRWGQLKAGYIAMCHPTFHLYYLYV